MLGPIETRRHRSERRHEAIVSMLSNTEMLAALFLFFEGEATGDEITVPIVMSTLQNICDARATLEIVGPPKLVTAANTLWDDVRQIRTDSVKDYPALRNELTDTRTRFAKVARAKGAT